MLKARFKKHVFNFKTPGGTSRGVLKTKDSWHILIWDTDRPEITGVGECSIIPKLSIDDRPDLEEKIAEVCETIHLPGRSQSADLDAFPSIRFGLEVALEDLESKGSKVLFGSSFTSNEAGIPINGLVWMGNYSFMRDQIVEKVEAGFTCIKLKIGSILFEDELSLLRMIRRDFGEKDLVIRVDANGAFHAERAPEVLKRLSEYRLHSIEQPIKQGQWEAMARLCENPLIPIALDEELIGVTDKSEKAAMIKTIQPQYLILKPGLLGGFEASKEFIELADAAGVNWWVTSALEGNIGLNAIAQWTATLNHTMPQGLGTGQLFSNNIPSPLTIREGHLYYDTGKDWNLNQILND